MCSYYNRLIWTIQIWIHTNYHFTTKKKKKKKKKTQKMAQVIPNLQLRNTFFPGTQERVWNSRGKRATSVRSTKVRLYGKSPMLPISQQYPPKSDHHPNPYRRVGGGRLTEGFGNFQRCTVMSVNQRCRSNKTFAIISLNFEIYNRLPKNGWAKKIATLTKTATLFSYCVPINSVIQLTHVGLRVWLLAHFISTAILGGERTIMKNKIIVQ